MEERELTLHDMWNIIWTYRKMILRNVTIVSIITIIITLLLPKWYKAQTVIMPPSADFGSISSLSSTFGFTGLSSSLQGDEDQNRIISILKSTSLLEAVARKFNFKERYDCENLEETIKEMENNLVVELGEEMQIIVSFWDRDQEMVADIANYIIYCLDSLNIALNTGKGRSSRQFIEKRVQEVIDSLRVLEFRLNTFMTNEGLLSLEDQVRVGVETAAELKAQIMAKEVELAIAYTTYDKNSPIIKLLRNELANLKSKYIEFFKEKSGEELIPSFTKIPRLSIMYSRFERQIDYYLKVLEFLAPEYESAKIEEVKDVPTIQVIDKAMRPERKDKPKRAKIVIIFFGLIMVLSMYYAYLHGRKAYIAKLSS